MNDATKLWKANLNSEYYAYRKTTNKTTGETTTRVKRSEDGDWEVLP